MASGRAVIRRPPTPPLLSYELQKTFRQFLDAGCDVALMEGVQPGPDDGPCGGVHYDIGVFTNPPPTTSVPVSTRPLRNTTRLEGQLFRRCDVGVVNIDDENTGPSGRPALLEGHTCKLVTYGRSEKADTTAPRAVSCCVPTIFWAWRSMSPAGTAWMSGEHARRGSASTTLATLAVGRCLAHPMPPSTRVWAVRGQGPRGAGAHQQSSPSCWTTPCPQRGLHRACSPPCGPITLTGWWWCSAAAATAPSCAATAWGDLCAKMADSPS